VKREEDSSQFLRSSCVCVWGSIQNIQNRIPVPHPATVLNIDEDCDAPFSVRNIETRRSVRCLKSDSISVGRARHFKLSEETVLRSDISRSSVKARFSLNQVVGSALWISNLRNS
jgi:hypothetical protein